MKIEDFHIGFEYEQLIKDESRYLNQGMIWVKQTYGLTSPRLFKINTLIKQGVIRDIEPVVIKENWFKKLIDTLADRHELASQKKCYCREYNLNGEALKYQAIEGELKEISEIVKKISQK